MSDRSDWFCSNCGKYSDPQSLNYHTGECWKCEEGVTVESPHVIMMTNNRRNKLRQIRKSERGSWCLFIKLDNTCGLKLYHKAEMRDASFLGQEFAAKNGLAPQVGEKFNLNKKDTTDLISNVGKHNLPYFVNANDVQFLYGYTTEIVDTDTTKICDDHGYELIERLKEIGFYVNDFVGAQVNMGTTKEGKLVCFDFDARNCYNYTLKNRIGPIV